MFSLILAVVLGLAYLRLRSRDRRMLRNGVVLVAALWFAASGAAQLLAEWIPGFGLLWLVVLALVPLAVLVLAGFLIANGITMLRSEGRRLGNLLTLLLGIAVLALPVIALLLVMTHHPVLVGLAALLFFLCGYAGVVFVVFLAAAVAYGRAGHDMVPEAIAILGSRLIGGRVPPLLASRLDKAVELYRAAPEPKPLLIPSGGQGGDESRPEGEGMAEYLRGAGIPTSDIVPEKQGPHHPGEPEILADGAGEGRPPGAAAGGHEQLPRVAGRAAGPEVRRRCPGGRIPHRALLRAQRLPA